MAGVTDLVQWIDDGPGERRWVLCDAEGRPAAIGLHRASWRGRRALYDSIFDGRVTRVDRSRRGAYLDLGLRDDAGFLPIDARGQARVGENAHAVVEGALLRVRVRREAAGGKNPVLALRGPAPAGAQRGPVAMRAYERAPFVREARDAIDAAVEEALSPSVAIPGGGRLIITPTAALVAIDVDAGGREGSRDPDAFAAALNADAAVEAVRQLQLRRLGGTIAIDFVSMRAKALRARTHDTLKRALAGLPRSARFTPPNALDVALLTLERQQTPLHELMLEPQGVKSPETVALEGLRALERTAASDRGAGLMLRVSPDVADWLKSAPFDWREALLTRGVARADVEAVPDADREMVDVRRI